MKKMSDCRRHEVMGLALHQAKKSLKMGEVPVGALVVDAAGKVISLAYNVIEKKQQQTAHAEMRAIQKACRKLESWRLNGYWLYVTLEPCLMCFGLIVLSRLDGVIFGAKSNLFGVEVNFGEKVKLPSYAKHMKIEGGLRQQEAVALLKEFFKGVRKERKASREAKVGIYPED